MKSFQSSFSGYGSVNVDSVDGGSGFFNEYERFVTPSDIIEFLYCRRFAYFMKFLGIAQYEEKRYKVMKGREVHDKKEAQNREYLRKKLGVKDKKVDLNLASPNLKLKGKVDEILFLKDNTAAPLDYKFAEFEEIIYNTYKTQMVIYSLLIEDVFKTPVYKAYIVYTRSKNLIKEIDIDTETKADALKYVEEYHRVAAGHFPSATKHKTKCIDCCYKNICIK